MSFETGSRKELTKDSPKRIVIYSHDTYGLGHLRRNLALAQALVRSSPNMRIVIVTGSRVAANFAQTPGIELVELPPVVKIGPDIYESHGIQIPLSLIKRARAAIMKDVLERFDPEIFYVDHSPLGMSNELIPVLEYLRTQRPGTLRIIGLRDIIDAPNNVAETWGKTGAMDAIQELYDQVFVFGEKHLFDLGLAYNLPESFAPKYLSYIGKPEFIEVSARRSEIMGSGSIDLGHLLITAGGGGDGKAVCLAGIKVARRLGVRAVVVVGPFMEKNDVEFLTALARDSWDLVVTDFAQNIEDLMLNARAAISMAGYNTITELSAARVPTLYFPRTYPREEQLVRARIFEGLGFGKVVEATNARWSEHEICVQVEKYWNNPILPISVQVNLSAIPRFTSQILVPDRFNNLGNAPSQMMDLHP